MSVGSLIWRDFLIVFNHIYKSSLSLYLSNGVHLETQGNVHMYPYKNELLLRTSENSEAFAQTFSLDASTDSVNQWNI